MASPVFNNDMVKGVAIGAGLVILVPLAAVTLAPLARPVLRQALKTGMLAFEKGREVVAEFGETVEDVTSEVQAELKATRLDETASAAAAEAVDEVAAQAGDQEPAG